MKFPVMTAFLLIAPTLALADPGRTDAPLTQIGQKRVELSLTEVMLEKKRVRLHVIERAAAVSGRAAADPLCASPTKMLRHDCVKGQGATSARQGAEMGGADLTGRQLRQSQNSRPVPSRPGHETVNRFFEPDLQAAPIKPTFSGPLKPWPRKPDLSGVKPTRPLVDPDETAGKPDKPRSPWPDKQERRNGTSHARKG